MRIKILDVVILLLNKFLYIWDVTATFLDNTQLKYYYSTKKKLERVSEIRERLLESGAYSQDWEDL
jgi:hypothetical protein